MIAGLEHFAGSPEREGECQKDIEPLVRQIIGEATVQGWGPIEANRHGSGSEKAPVDLRRGPGPGNAPLASELDPSNDGDSGAA